MVVITYYIKAREGWCYILRENFFGKGKNTKLISCLLFKYKAAIRCCCFLWLHATKINFPIRGKNLLIDLTGLEALCNFAVYLLERRCCIIWLIKKQQVSRNLLDYNLVIKGWFKQFKMIWYKNIDINF